MLDTHLTLEMDEIEAVRRIHAGIAVEAPVTAKPAPESAALDRSRENAAKPRPQPRVGTGASPVQASKRSERRDRTNRRSPS